MREHIAISMVLIVASTPLAAQTQGCRPVPVVVTVADACVYFGIGPEVDDLVRPRSMTHLVPFRDMG